MFEEFIAQGESMVERLGLERGRSSYEIENIPAAKRVPIVEMEKWMQKIRIRIAEKFSPDTVLRFDDVKSITSRDIKRDKDSPAEQAILQIGRIMELMHELEKRALGTKNGPA